jgi:hypothetical protein
MVVLVGFLDRTDQQATGYPASVNGKSAVVVDPDFRL